MNIPLIKSFRDAWKLAQECKKKGGKAVVITHNEDKDGKKNTTHSVVVKKT